MKNKKIWSPIIAGIVFAVILILDLTTKEVVISHLIPNVGDSVEVMPGFINFVYIENRGGAWGIFSNSTIGLAIISIIILILILLFFVLRLRKVKNESSMWLAVSIGLVAGGCIGNMIDRFALGFVRDFINFQFINFPVFNFADVAICVGVVTLMIYFLFFYSKEEKANKEDKKEGGNEWFLFDWQRKCATR